MVPSLVQESLESSSVLKIKVLIAEETALGAYLLVRKIIWHFKKVCLKQCL